jgi:hypothetical protein
MLAGLFTTGTTATARTLSVPAGGDVQAALTNAQPGDTIALAPGATFVGNFTLPLKGGDAVITLRTGGTDAVEEGVRIEPAAAAGLAKLRSPNNQPVLQTAASAHHWRVTLLEFQANAGGLGDILTLGSGAREQSSLAVVPHDLAVDRCFIHGDPAVGQKRCVALNSASTSITNSYISDCKAKGQDAQAIAGWNGPGPFTISNNYLEGAGDNVLFGGADPAIPNLVPSDITFTRNTVSKVPAWRSEGWTVKNIFELKNARRVIVRGNTFEYNWLAAQNGFAILFTVRNQDGACPWCEVREVTFENNLIQHVAAAISILGVDYNHPSQQTASITIRNSVFADIDSERWGGNGYFLMLLGGARDITVDHNTIVQDHAQGIILVEGPPVLGFRFTNNLVRHNLYGIIGQDHAPDRDTISAFLPASEITRNVIADGDAAKYPPGNSCPPSAQFKAQFVAYDDGDFRLTPTSTWRAAGTDGQNLGADVGAVPRSPIDRAPWHKTP